MYRSTTLVVAASVLALLSACAAGPTEIVTAQENALKALEKKNAETRRRLLLDIQSAADQNELVAQTANEKARLARAKAEELAEQAIRDPGLSDEAEEAAIKAAELGEKAKNIADEAKETANLTEAVAEDTDNPTNSLTDWQGWGLGAAFSVTFDAGGEDRIGSVSLDENDIVRVDEERNVQARIGLEGHYFGDCVGLLGKLVRKWIGEGQCGVGPFFAIHTSEDEIIDTVGFGIMAGFKRAAEEGNNSWNIGLGAEIDPSVTVLGTDVRENEALPAGETQIRTRTENQWGIMLIFSRTFYTW